LNGNIIDIAVQSHAFCAMKEMRRTGIEKFILWIYRRFLAIASSTTHPKSCHQALKTLSIAPTFQISVPGKEAF